jgi:pyruvate/2-oxoglutarate/acetoin dehydrogenase E1 component
MDVHDVRAVLVGPGPEEVETIPLGTANVVRAGGDVTIVALGKGVPDTLAAADTLMEEGIDAEVIDLRCLRPLDTDTILASVAGTNRLVAVEEGPRSGGWSAGVLGAVVERALYDLDDAWIVASAETRCLYPTLEDAYIPDAQAIRVGRARAARVRALAS